MAYIGKVGAVYVVTLTLADTWYAVLTSAQASCIRGFKIKSRYTHGGLPPGPFDYAFSAAPAAGDSAGSGFWSNSGAGAGDEAGPVSGIWAKSAVAGTIIEIMTYA